MSEHDQLIRDVRSEVLGDDGTAKYPEWRMEECLCAWCRGVTQSNNTYTYHMPRGLPGFVVEDSQGGWYLALWRNREGQPWQADIEAHVAAWRAPLPALDWLLMQRVVEAIVLRGGSFDLELVPMAGKVGAVCRIASEVEPYDACRRFTSGEHDSAELCVLEAALAYVRAEKGAETR